MEDPIKEVSGNEGKHILAQFLGQNINELKKLDSNIIAGNTTLRGLTIDLNQIGADIPVAQLPVSTAPTVMPAITVTTTRITDQPVQLIPPKTENINISNSIDQLEFTFKTSPDALFNKLDDIYRQNKTILDTLNLLVESINNSSFNLKKKN